MRGLCLAATRRAVMSFPANKPLGMIGALALGAAVLPWPATAQGVPIVDPKSIIQHGLEIGHGKTSVEPLLQLPGQVLHGGGTDIPRDPLGGVQFNCQYYR